MCNLETSNLDRNLLQSFFLSLSFRALKTSGADCGGAHSNEGCRISFPGAKDLQYFPKKGEKGLGDYRGGGGGGKGEEEASKVQRLKSRKVLVFFFLPPPFLSIQSAPDLVSPPRFVGQIQRLYTEKPEQDAAFPKYKCEEIQLYYKNFSSPNTPISNVHD